MLLARLLKTVFIFFTLISIVSTSSIAQGSIKNSLLIHYSASGNLFMVKLLLKMGASPNSVNKSYNMASIASTNGHRFRLRGKRYSTALIAAVRNNHIKVVQALIEDGADPDIRDFSGDTALTVAAEHSDDTYLVQILVLDAQASINIQNRSGYTPLMKAVMSNREDVTRALLDLGANPNIQDKFNRSPLIMAIKHNNADIVQMLLDAGADPNFDKYNILEGPILQASRKGNGRIVKMLSKAGADLNVQTQSGKTPLIMAIDQNHADVVQILIEEGANPNCEKQKIFNCPIIRAIERRNKETIKILAEAGADLNIQDEEGYTPLMMTIQQKHTDGFFTLLNAGADPRLKNKYGETVLKMIVYSDSHIHNPPVDLVQALIDAGASPVIEGEFGRLEVFIEDIECTDALTIDTPPL